MTYPILKQNDKKNQLKITKNYLTTSVSQETSRAMKRDASLSFPRYAPLFVAQQPKSVFPSLETSRN